MFRLRFAIGKIGYAQVGSDVEQIILNDGQLAVDRVGQSGSPRQPQHGIQLIRAAIGDNAGMLLGDATAVTQRGFAGVATTRVDAVEKNQDDLRVTYTWGTT